MIYTLDDWLKKSGLKEKWVVISADELAYRLDMETPDDCDWGGIEELLKTKFPKKIFVISYAEYEAGREETGHFTIYEVKK